MFCSHHPFLLQRCRSCSCHLFLVLQPHLFLFQQRPTRGCHLFLFQQCTSCNRHPFLLRHCTTCGLHHALFRRRMTCGSPPFLLQWRTTYSRLPFLLRRRSAATPYPVLYRPVCPLFRLPTRFTLLFHVSTSPISPPSKQHRATFLYLKSLIFDPSLPGVHSQAMVVPPEDQIFISLSQI